MQVLWCCDHCFADKKQNFLAMKWQVATGIGNQSDVYYWYSRELSRPNSPYIAISILCHAACVRARGPDLHGVAGFGGLCCLHSGPSHAAAVQLRSTLRWTTSIIKAAPQTIVPRIIDATKLLRGDPSSVQYIRSIVSAFGYIRRAR